MKWLFILLGAAGVFYYTQAQKFVDSLQYAVNGVQFNGIDANALALTVKVRLTNPTGFACPVMAVNLAIIYNGVELTRVYGNAFNIPANGHVDVVLPAAVNIYALPAAVRSAVLTFVGGQQITVRIKGHVALNPLVTIPVDANTVLV